MKILTNYVVYYETTTPTWLFVFREIKVQNVNNRVTKWIEEDKERDGERRGEIAEESDHITMRTNG